MNAAALSPAILISTTIAVPLAAAILSYLLLRLLLPVLQRYAMALPNARSSHKVPTPQGAGIGVVAATVTVVLLTCFYFGGLNDRTLWIILAAAICIAVVGAVDDILQLSVMLRLLLQAATVTAMLFTLPDDLRIVPMLPFWVERFLLALGALWFVNLTNFMDGIDWITAAEVVPVAAFVAIIGIIDSSPFMVVVVALALCGAMIGFAPLNRPVAKMFLGDVGSLAIGLLLAWMLIGLAGRGHVAAAMLLPLYYVADATITLLRRMMRGEKVWVAHRTHFYQRATQGGFTVMQTVLRILVINVGLGLLALICIYWNDSITVQAAALIAGAALVAWLLYVFATGRKPTP